MYFFLDNEGKHESVNVILFIRTLRSFFPLPLLQRTEILQVEIPRTIDTLWCLYLGSVDLTSLHFYWKTNEWFSSHTYSWLYVEMSSCFFSSGRKGSGLLRSQISLSDKPLVKEKLIRKEKTFDYSEPSPSCYGSSWKSRSVNKYLPSRLLWLPLSTVL